jgi:hypothetical protein
MIQGQAFFDKESSRLKEAISKPRIFTLGQTRQLFNLEVAGAQA